MKLPIRLEDSSRPTNRLATGFTLIEIVVVLGIIAVVGAIGLSVGINSFQSYICVSQFDLLRSALFYARSEAVTASEGAKVGLFVDNNKISVYLDRVETTEITEVHSFEFDRNFEIVFPNNEIVFTKKNVGLTVDKVAEDDNFATLIGPACNRNINLKENGAIVW